ncbi:MAG: aldo/keto reductase, partial [Eggerthellaceae bacterium]|nr:aldo/keto reductase [Eggerthellaceae bacterium]
MQYFSFKGHDLSALGFGCMRLPIIDEKPDNIDEAQVADMVAYAMEHGINYYDTAWGYHDGNSELVMGRVLSQYPRDSFYLASKFPSYDPSNFGKHEEIFARQLEKCQTDYFDFYLLHNINEGNIDHYLEEEKYGTVAYFKAMRDAGKIGHLGFSVHGTFETFMRFMEVFSDDMEFCQVQLNYMDWNFQKARAKVEVLQERHIPIIVMEPLRGGNLISFSEEQMASLNALRPGKSAVDWAFRWTAGVPGVMTVLSGMSNMEQLQDNVRIFEDDEPLTAEECAALEAIGDEIASSKGVPCTACRYCTEYCPQELDIPR